MKDIQVTFEIFQHIYILSKVQKTCVLLRRPGNFAFYIEKIDLEA